MNRLICKHCRELFINHSKGDKDSLLDSVEYCSECLSLPSCDNCGNPLDVNESDHNYDLICDTCKEDLM